MMGSLHSSSSVWQTDGQYVIALNETQTTGPSQWWPRLVLSSSTVLDSWWKRYCFRYTKVATHTSVFFLSYWCSEICAGRVNCCLSIQTFLECVRLRTFGRYGLQQIQVDTHYLQLYLWRFVADEKYACSAIIMTIFYCRASFLPRLHYGVWGIYTHTHPFNGPLSRTSRMSLTRKVKPIWILLKQETVSGSGISWAICKSALSSDR